jgi:hypothetical protein
MKDIAFKNISETESANKSIDLYFQKLETLLSALKRLNSGALNRAVEEAAKYMLVPDYTELLEKTINSAKTQSPDSIAADIISAIKEMQQVNNGNTETQDISMPTERKAPHVETLKSIIPSTHIIPNTKLSREIIRDFPNKIEVQLALNSNKKKEITTLVMLSYNDGNVNFTGPVPFEGYDREVHDAVVTLYNAGNTVISVPMVYRAMNGMMESETVSSHSLDEIRRSIEKCNIIKATIDCTQEVIAYNNNCNKTSNYKLKGNLLDYRIATEETKDGKTYDVYILIAKPILYEYAQISGQIYTVPISLLQTKGVLRNTKDVTVIRSYLIRQIEGMKSPKFKRSKKITFSGVYAELDITQESLSAQSYKDKTKKMRKHVETLLDELKRQKYIKGYERYKKGNTIEGVDIKL